MMNKPLHLYNENIGSSLVIIGGAEDKKKNPAILKHFVELAGGPKASILLVPIASAIPLETAEIYTEVFKQLGVKQVTALKASHREDVLHSDLDSLFKGVSGLFMTGGDQMRLMSIMGGTPFAQLLRHKVKEGLVLGGTSAGAAGMGSNMIVRGKSTAKLHQDATRLSPGLGILKHIIVDQHFSERMRRSRLITAVCYNPKNLGIGIDENTAVIISKNGTLEVMGNGTVTIVDGSHIRYTNIAEVKAHAPFGVFNIQLHILTEGMRYDIFSRSPYLDIKERSVS